MLHTHYFRRVRCPKCNEITDRNSTDRTFTVFGSPYRVCKYCGAPYYDPGYSEMAIDAFESKGTMLGFPGIFALLVYNGFAGYIVFSGLLKDVRMWVVFLMALPVSLWYDYKLIETIRNRIHAEEYHQEQIDLLEGRLGIMSDELAESMKRMSDRGYLDALRSHGVDVPEYFYKRLGSEEGTFAEPEGIEEAESYYLNV